jgi:ribosomal protein S27E
MFFPIGRLSNIMNFRKFLINIFKKKEIINTKERIHKTKMGIICPRCRNSSMEYDGLLNLHCKACGYIIAGSFT